MTDREPKEQQWSCVWKGDFMDQTGRKITKIAREVGKFTVQTMKEEGIGTAEFDFIHLVRHNPGITQTEVREALKIDKGATARRAASLEAKGYLERKPNPADGRSQLLYATKKAEALKNSKASIEAVFMSGCWRSCRRRRRTRSARRWINCTGGRRMSGGLGLLMFRSW